MIWIWPADDGPLRLVPGSDHAIGDKGTSAATTARTRHPETNAAWAGSVALKTDASQPKIQVIMVFEHPATATDGEKDGHLQPLADLIPPPGPADWYSVSLLKSNLQKAVRRRCRRAAVRTAWQLMRQDMNEFLRRMPVIIVEDSLLHPQYDKLVWLMCAFTKGFRLFSLRMVAMLLQLVADTASMGVRDFTSCPAEAAQLPVAEVIRKWFRSLPRVASNAVDCGTSPWSLVLALLARRAFGGMSFDIHMLECAASMWFGRLCDPAGLCAGSAPAAEIESDCPSSSVSSSLSSAKVAYDRVWKQFRDAELSQQDGSSVASPDLRGCFCAQDRLLFAVDFHCSSILQQFEHNPDIECLRTAMWYHWSGVNSRCFFVGGSELLAETAAQVVACAPIWEAYKQRIIASAPAFWRPRGGQRPANADLWQNKATQQHDTVEADDLGRRAKPKRARGDATENIASATSTGSPPLPKTPRIEQARITAFFRSQKSAVEEWTSTR